jgi:2-methylcitrate dehydratase PrpD
MTAEPLLAPLARHVSALKIDPADAALRDRLWTTAIDWATALAAGAAHPLAASYQKALLDPAEGGTASVAGDTRKHPLASAAMMNAALSHFWEVDDAHRDSTMHPGITVLPVVVALSQTHGLAATDIAAAVVAGVEAGLRVGAHLGGRHYAVCHTTATAGTFGAAAAAARALRLDAEATLSAFGHAGTQAAGLWQMLDDGLTAPKAFHAATAVRNGLAAARMAAAGLPGAPRILEGKRGMRTAWHLEGCDDGWLMPGGMAMIHNVTVKAWPVCGQMHSALDCARELADKHPDAGCSAQRIVVDLPQSALDIASIENPKTLTEAKFSTAFCVAATLRGHPPDFTGLNKVLLADPAVRDLARRVELRSQDAFTARFPKERPARVTLHRDAALPLVEERSFRKGDPEVPWTREEMLVRSRDVLALTPRTLDVHRLVDWCDGLAEGRPSWRAGNLFDLFVVPAQERLVS